MIVLNRNIQKSLEIGHENTDECIAYFEELSKIKMTAFMLKAVPALVTTLKKVTLTY